LCFFSSYTVWYEDVIFIERATDYCCHFYAWLYYGHNYFDWSITGPFS